MPDDKKLFIDEDWKSQVQAEKERAQHPGEPASTGAQSTAASPAPDPHEVADFPMPPASLEVLITTLAAEALVAMGQMPHPATGQVRAHRNQAQYLIDTIDILKQKTKGNLTPAEQHTIDSLLYQLRMIFVETANQLSDAAASGNDK